MRIATSALLISVMTLTSCATVRDSRVNPFNWFGGSTSQPVQAEAPKANNPLLPERTGIFAKQRAREGVYQGKPVDQVTELVIERVPGGALIRATGITRTQGAYDVQLTPETDTETPVDGVLTYRLEALGPVQRDTGWRNAHPHSHCRATCVRQGTARRAPLCASSLNAMCVRPGVASCAGGSV